MQITPLRVAQTRLVRYDRYTLGPGQKDVHFLFYFHSTLKMNTPFGQFTCHNYKECVSRADASSKPTARDKLIKTGNLIRLLLPRPIHHRHIRVLDFVCRAHTPQILTTIIIFDCLGYGNLICQLMTIKDKYSINDIVYFYDFQECITKSNKHRGNLIPHFVRF